MADTKATTKRKLTRPSARAFNEDETELLIAEWVKYPCLYDKICKDYQNRNQRDMARNEIAKNMNQALKLQEEDSIKGWLVAILKWVILLFI